MSYKFEKNYNGGQDIVIDGWEKGIAQSPYLGISDNRGCDIDSIPGVVMARGPVFDFLKQAGTNASIYGYSATFTADTGTDILTMSVAVPTTYFAVTFSNSGGALPTGLSAATIYYLASSGTTTKVATTIQNLYAGTFVDITGAGSGTNTATGVNMSVVKQTVSQWYQLNSNPNSTSVNYCFDSNGRVWALNYILPNQWTLITGAGGTSYVNGIAVFQNWLFLFRDNKIDVMGKLTGAISTHTWYNNWKTLAGGSSMTGLRKTLVGQDNVLYWTDYDDAYTTARLGYIGSLREVAGQTLFADTGNPSSSSATTNYTYNNNSLDFAGGVQPVALAELNTKLVIATSQAQNFTQNQENVSQLYTWDRVSPSFDFPLNLPFLIVNDIKNVNNIIYIFGGRKGIVYKTDLSSVQEAFTIPKQLYTLNSGTSYYEGNPLNSNSGFSSVGGFDIDGINFGYQSVVQDRKLFFSVSYLSMTGLYTYDLTTGAITIIATPLAGAGTDQSTDMVGIYSIALSSYSTGTTSGYAILMFGGKYTGSNTYFVDGYINGGTNNGATTYLSYVTSDLVSTGTVNNKKTLQQLEYKLDKKMGTQSGLKIYYRTAIGDSWTLLTTDDYATNGAIASRNISLPLNDIEWIQVKVALEYNTRLREIRLR